MNTGIHRGLHQKRGNRTIKTRRTSESESWIIMKKEKDKRAHFENIHVYCTFAKSTNRASIRYFNLIKFYIQHDAAALIFYFYECRILLSRQTNKIDFFSFVFSIRVYFVIRTHGRKYARIKKRCECVQMEWKWESIHSVACAFE